MIFFFNITVTTSAQCSRYHTSLNIYISISGIADPQACVYAQTITEPRTVLSVTSAVAKENIAILEISPYVAGKYLPINVGAEFPNVLWYRALYCGIIGISKDNFDGMMKANWIDLQSNKIASISSDTFRLVPSLRQLNLSEFFFKIKFQNKQ